MSRDSFHPSDIKLREEHCGHAVTLRKQRTPFDRNIFQTGIAAHAYLEAVGKYSNQNENVTIDDVKRIINQTMTELTTGGRAYDGVPEAPMTIQQALDGKEIAIKHWVYNPLPADGIYEMPIAFNKDWEEVDYFDDSAFFRTLLDMVTVTEVTDEDGDTTKIVTVRDFKTSWHITNDMLDNIQRRAQAVVAWLKYPDADIIKVQVFGLRNGKLIEREIFTQIQNEVLERWKNDIHLAVEILQQPQTAKPGANCVGCPYAHACQYISKRFKQHEHIIERYISCLAIVKALEPEIKKITKNGNYKTNGGIVGYAKKTKKAADKNSLLVLWDTWKRNNGDPESFIKMLSPTATVIKKISKTLSKTGVDGSTFEETLIKESSYSSFGVHKI